MADKIATREAYGDALVEFGAKYDIVVLDADLAEATKTVKFKKAYPGKPTCYAAIVDNVFRAPSIRYMKTRLQLAEAPTYSYMLSYAFDYMGTYPTFHCAELPLVFHNIDLIEIYGAEACEKLQAEMAGAWVAFARCGDPSHEGIGTWAPYDAEKGTTMVFDEVTRAGEHYDRELMRMCTEYKPVVDLMTAMRMMKKAEKEEEDLAAHPY